MKQFEDITKTELRDLLVTNWITHDAMWLSNTVQQCGIEKANLINRQAVKAMAALEARRLKAVLQFDRINNFEELKTFIITSFELIRGPFMYFTVSFPEKNIMQWKCSNCFAYNGVCKLGIISLYQCGIFERVDGWFDSLGIPFTVSPEITGCLMHETGKCEREYRFNL